MSDEEGSILLETLIALTIVAFMLAAVYRAIGESVLRSRAAEERRVALMIARSQLAAVGSDIPLASGRTRGQAAGMAWRVEIGARGGSASRSGRLMAVTVVVEPMRARAAPLTLRTLRLAEAP